MPPIVKYITVSAPIPKLSDNLADIDRLKRALLTETSSRPLSIPFAQLSNVAAAFRQAKFSGTAVINDLGERLELVDFVDIPGPLTAMA